MTTQTSDRSGSGGKGGAGSGGAGKAARAKQDGKGEARPATVATPWGPATLAGQAGVAQRAGERRFTSVVQLLADERGEPLVRFAYTTGGVVRRGPVTLRARDLERLRVAAAGQPALAALLGWGEP